MNDLEELTGLKGQIERLAIQLERAQFAEYVQLLNRPTRLFFINFFSGIARGVGSGLGFTVVLAVLLMLLQRLAVLHLPLIGQFLAEIVRIVQAELHTVTKP